MIRHGVINLNQMQNKGHGQTFLIKKVFQHPKYIGTAYFDLAVLQIAPVKFNANLRPICLPSSSDFKIDHYEDKTTTLIGWGSKDNTDLKTSILTIYEYR